MLIHGYKQLDILGPEVIFSEALPLEADILQELLYRLVDE